MDSHYEVFTRPKEAGGTKKEFYMRNFFNARIVRLLGIISLALIIGFSMAACSSDDGGGSGGGGGGGGSGGATLTFTGEIPAAIKTEIDACTAADISYFPSSGVLSATAMPVDANAAETLIYDSANTVASLNDNIATITSTKKCKLVGSTSLNFTGSGAHVVYIKFDNSGNKLWLAPVTLTKGSGTVAWTAFKNANDLASGSGPGGDSGGLPAGAVTGLTVPAPLQGTWVGDADNGTLVFTASGVGTSSGLLTKAGSFVGALDLFVNTAGYTIAISGGKITGTITGVPPEDIYTYTISGTTLTIKVEGGETAFTGTKQ
jgi:hypothetical protein